ncbi:MAG TPA: hypothetical protein VHG32_16630 [Thermoanaerobaculia bacterium]|jgi:hypothetical protein|nr:hypothetical protein [Thermoanaerobaculia bacterium]
MRIAACHAAIVVVVAVALLSAGTAIAQVTVSKAAVTDEQAPCPMQLDVKLGALGRRPSLREVQVGHAWFSDEMQKYVCHTERISRLMVLKKSEKRGRLEMSITTTVKSEQWRQDVDLTVSLLDPTGKQLCSNSWKDLTVGKDREISNYTWVTMASRTKTPEMDCTVDATQFAEMFSGDSLPEIRIMLKPKVDEDEKK